MRTLLNVGGGNRNIALPEQYEGWEQVLLDIDAQGNPDIVLDARRLTELPPEKFDAVYCSHNLEHYYRHDGVKVLSGFRHVLKSDGFVHIRVPDIGEVMRLVVRDKMDVDDVLYQSAVGPITVHDVLYGYGLEIRQSGNDYYAHKTGFTHKALGEMLSQCGFPHIFMYCANLEVVAYAFKHEPTVFAVKLLKLSADSA